MPRCSVLLPAKNGIPLLARAVESILIQTFDDFELVVIED
jgi:glycosyltransferase involved in cell wall biosynthesis